MSDQSFVAQIQQAEEEAADLVSQAQSKQGDDLVAHEQKLAQKRLKHLDTARDKAREKLKDQQSKAKDAYAKQMKEAEKEAKSIGKKMRKVRLKSALSAAEAYFLDLLGVK